MRSWQTTTFGILTIVSAVTGAVALLLDRNPETNPDWNSVFNTVMIAMSLIFSGIGLIRARDNNKSSKDVGVK